MDNCSGPPTVKSMLFKDSTSLCSWGERIDWLQSRIQINVAVIEVSLSLPFLFVRLGLSVNYIELNIIEIIT